MKDPQEQLVIRDYLHRKRWYYIVSALLHFVITLTSSFAEVTPLIAILGGSAFLLSFDLMRGGGSAVARTMLSLPVTKKQLARSWRFVALEFPVALYLAVLVLASLISLLIPKNETSIDSFILIALGQTGMLGVMFFALTGVPAAAGTARGFAQRTNEIFFGIVWGASFPAILFLSNAFPTSLAACGPGHMLAGVLIIAATISGWFRAETLVDRRSKRKAVSSTAPRSSNSTSKANAESWSKFGGLPYFCGRFGLILSLMFAMMLSMMWIMFEFFMKLNSGGGASTTSDNQVAQAGMFIAIFTMISMLQVIPSLRLLRTLPLRLSTITHCLVLWPLILTAAFALAAYILHSALFGHPFDPVGYLTSMASCASILLGLPLILRFGMGFKTILPICLLLGGSQTFSVVGREVLKLDFMSYWLP